MIGEDAVERGAGQLCAPRRGTAEAAEKARRLSRLAERVGMRGSQCPKAGLVDERLDGGGRRRLAQLLGLPAEAEAAVAARLVAQLAEVRDERVPGAALGGDARQR